MRTEIKTVCVRCDVCHAELVIQIELDRGFYEGAMDGYLPGWDFISYPDGMTQHKLGIETEARRLELCPDCLKKIGK